MEKKICKQLTRDSKDEIKIKKLNTCVSMSFISSLVFIDLLAEMY